MRRFLVILCTVFSCLYVSAYQKTCTPEQFGAKGDGVHDDYPAISRAVKSAGTLVLSGGKKYRIKSADSFRIFEVDHSLRIVGNGATIIFDRTAVSSVYSSTEKHIFMEMFGNGFGCSVDSFVVENLTVVVDANTSGIYSPAEEYGSGNYVDGDIFLFCVKSTDQIYRNVTVMNDGKYNNFTVITNYKADRLILDRCFFKNQCLGYRGGILWMMLKDGFMSDISVTNCRFIHDAHDESFCLSVLDGSPNKHNRINASFRKCRFESEALCDNSGFFILYDNRQDMDNVYSANLKFDSCDARNRRFLSQQGDNCTYNTTISFKNSTFTSDAPHYSSNHDPYVAENFFSPRKLSERQTSVVTFNKCRFKTNNSVIDPYCGEKKGEYFFNNCSFDCYAVCESSVNYNVDFSAYFTSCNISCIQPFTVNCNEYYSKCNFYLPCDSLFVRSEWDGRYKKEFKGIKINGKAVYSQLEMESVGQMKWDDSRGKSQSYFGYSYGL